MPEHMRSRTTSSEKNGEPHFMQRCQPTRLTTRGGVQSASSTGSRLAQPSNGHGCGQLYPAGFS